MADAEDTFRHHFVDMNRTGTLAVVLSYVRHRAQVAETALREYLRTQPLVTPEHYAHVQLLQGKLSAYADLLKTMTTMGERPAPRKEPNGAHPPQ